MLFRRNYESRTLSTKGSTVKMMTTDGQGDCEGGGLNDVAHIPQLPKELNGRLA